MTSETDEQFLNRLGARRGQRAITGEEFDRLFTLARRGAAVAHTDDKRAFSPFANSEDPECTDCRGTGVTLQTERRCSCQPPPPAGEPRDE